MSRGRAKRLQIPRTGRLRRKLPGLIERLTLVIPSSPTENIEMTGTYRITRHAFLSLASGTRVSLTCLLALHFGRKMALVWPGAKCKVVAPWVRGGHVKELWITFTFQFHLTHRRRNHQSLTGLVEEPASGSAFPPPPCPWLQSQ